MGGAAYNPWTLQDYFKTVPYTLVYSSNLGFEEFFMCASFFSYIKIYKYFMQKDKKNLTFFIYGKILLCRFLRLAPVYYFVFLSGWLIGS